MTYFDQGEFDVRCEWGMNGVQWIAPSGVIIIVDVLSFTTCVDVALGRGATVLPYRWRDESAVRYAHERSAELAALRSHSVGNYSLSPSSLLKAPPGLRLVLPSPNGSSLAFAAMASGAVVLAGCLRNASAVAAWAQRLGRQITVIPGGERWPDGSLRPAIEDLAGAGAIIKKLQGRFSPEAEVAAATFDGMSVCLRDQLLSCSSGRELVEAGFESDVELAAKLDVSNIVPVLINEEFIVASLSVV